MSTIATTTLIESRAGELIEAEFCGYDYSSVSVVDVSYVGEWAWMPVLGIIDEYVPVGLGDHEVVVELLGREQSLRYEIRPEGQVYRVFESLTINPMHRDEFTELKSGWEATPVAFSGTAYPAGSSVTRTGGCWRLVGIQLATGCRSFNCTSAGSQCEVTVLPPGSGSESWGESNECVASGPLDVLVKVCPSGEAQVWGMPCISGC